MLLGAAVTAWMWYRGSAIDARVYAAEELKRGMRAQIVAWPGQRTAVQISRYVELPPDAVWQVVTDQARFDEFMPYVRKTTVRPGPGGTLIESQILDLPHASYNLELEIRLEQEGTRRTARWRQMQGALEFNEGAWVVEAAPGGGSVLRYQVSASLGIVPQWFVNYAMSKRLGRLLEAVERRTRALQSAASSRPGQNP